MEQGIVCAGSATRSGCGVRCPNSGMPCRGCYGPMPNVVDQGAKIVSAVSSIIDSKDPEEIEKILAGHPGYNRIRLPVRDGGILTAEEYPLMAKKISIDPITRLEGHGKIEIFLNDDGSVKDCYFQIPELRGFERFVVGRPIEELPRIVTRICGVCPASHHMAGAKAVDGCFGGELPPLAYKLRDMYYNAHYIHSHIAHFYALAAPDFVCGPTSDPATRNILGVVAKVGLEIGGQGHQVPRAGAADPADHRRPVHAPCWCIPGGVSKGIKPEELAEIKPMVDELYDFTQFSLKLFKDVVLGNKDYVELILNGPYTLDVQNMGLVDENNAPNFYDGKVRVVDFQGKEICKYAAEGLHEQRRRARRALVLPEVPVPEGPRLEGICGRDRLEHLHGDPAFPAQRGRPDGHAEGAGSVRGDVQDPGRKPCKALMAQHWARLVEMVQNAETLKKYCRRPGNHRRQVPRRPAEDHRRGRGDRRGDARHADASLHLRPERDLHQREPDRRHHEQQRADPHGHEEGRVHDDQAGE